MKLDKSKFRPYFTSTGVVVDNVSETFPGAVYVGQFPLQVKEFARFSDSAHDVFYVQNPDVEKGHSNYFALYVRDGKGYVTNAKHIESLMLSVYTDKECNYIYPRFQHDFRHFDETSFCDGGAWIEDSDTKMFSMWGRCGGDVLPSVMNVIIKDGEFFKI